MRILLVTEFFPYSEAGEFRGGVEARAFYLAEELTRRHEVTVIAARERGDRADQFKNLKVLRVGPEREYSQAGSFFDRLKYINNAVKVGLESRAEIVDGYNFVAYPIAYRIGKKLAIPAVATYHDVWKGEWIKNMGLVAGLAGEMLERYVLSRPWSGLIANSSATKEKLIAAGVRPEKIEVAYNGISLAKLKGITTEKFSDPTVIYVGRLVKYKKVADLIEAVAILKNKIKNLKCLIIGSGPETQSLKSLTMKLNLDETVTFLGFVEKHRQVLEYLSRSHVFCLPSAVEGFGMVTIEAMALGVPYVNSEIKPTIEVTKNGQGGLLYTLGSVEELAFKIGQLLDDAPRRQKLSLEARTLAKSYDWQNITRQVESIYQKYL
jgi:glycosyltransferase involved in cell wall biosynthesis